MFGVENLSKSGIMEHMVSIMDLLRGSWECIICCYLVLEKYCSEYDDFDGDPKFFFYFFFYYSFRQFFGLGVLIGWKTFNCIGKNDEFDQFDWGKKALSLVQVSFFFYLFFE
jgi:hypothetical protein